jgi:hypothetical protein
MSIFNRYPTKENKRLEQQKRMLQERQKALIEEYPELWKPLLEGHSEFIQKEGEEVSRWWISKEREQYVDLSKWLVELGFLALSLAYPLVLLFWSRSDVAHRPGWLLSLLYIGFILTLISVLAGLSYCLYFNKTIVDSARILSEIFGDKASEYKRMLGQKLSDWVKSEGREESFAREDQNRLIDSVYETTLHGVLSSLHGEAIRTQEAFHIVLWQIGLFCFGSVVLFVALSVAFFVWVG